MKVLILNGASYGDEFTDRVENVILEEFKKLGHSVKSHCLKEIEIANCLGCFGCWIKTPGVCVIDDAGRGIAKDVVHAHLVVNLTPITFGGYSYELKKVFDRLIPIISPFFMKLQGEVHHKPRYKSYPKLITIGILKEMDDDAVEVFKNLVARNSVNFHNPKSLSGVFLHNQSSQEIRKEIIKLIQAGGA